ncbi:hypothetical protein IGS74_09115 [Aureimonas sp. OT7]|uniref:hypothetical protein n=1 Tax=Aureimonas sp. OT7 TaxID=2816454 RepID=UPI00177FE94B|nr:hypothetical protein [Aureimonas sp. OT7]QOG08281.1 hypothetical protein IGS74_09115 [Aureimonas sp. OT7]
MGRRFSVGRKRSMPPEGVTDLAFGDAGRLAALLVQVLLYKIGIADNANAKSLEANAA